MWSCGRACRTVLPPPRYVCPGGAAPALRCVVSHHARRHGKRNGCVGRKQGRSENGSSGRVPLPVIRPTLPPSPPENRGIRFARQRLHFRAPCPILAPGRLACPHSAPQRGGAAGGRAARAQRRRRRFRSRTQPLRSRRAAPRAAPRSPALFRLRRFGRVAVRVGFDRSPARGVVAVKKRITTHKSSTNAAKLAVHGAPQLAWA